MMFSKKYVMWLDLLSLYKSQSTLQNISELLFLFHRQENMELIGEMAQVAQGNTVIQR